jgi:hypothetical protein
VPFGADPFVSFHWNTEDVFRRVLSGFASVMPTARRLSWNINPIKNARMEAAFV